jgi:hypothetical protein
MVSDGMGLELAEKKTPPGKAAAGNEAWGGTRHERNSSLARACGRKA